MPDHTQTLGAQKLPVSCSVVIPVYADDLALRSLLTQIQSWRLPTVVVDGASALATRHVVEEFACFARYLASQPGRGQQIACGLQHVYTPWVWVLHADTQPSEGAFAYMVNLSSTKNYCWGRFDVDIPGLALVAFMMNLRSRLTRICTGDQGMFFSVRQLQALGGFPDQPLMEDIEVSKLMKRAGFPFVPRREVVRASSRRWMKQGILKTVVSMWWYRLRYFCGADAEALYQRYYGRK